jgi:signal peptide peptidase SppA
MEFVEFHVSRWLMERAALRALLKSMSTASPSAIRAAVAGQSARSLDPQRVGDVAVINVTGPISYLDSWFSVYFGGATIQSLQQQFRAALADSAVRAILFRFNSPGGLVDMVPEFADEIFAARGAKPIVAVADLCMCSAAYYLASQADTIYATRSSQIGSIGVWMEHDDISKMLENLGVKVTLIAYGAHKVDGNPYEPLPEDVEAQWQADIDELGDEFTKAVARGRGVTPKVVLDTFGQGLVFRGKKAVTLGLADKLGTPEQLVATLGSGRLAGTAAHGSRATSTRQAEDEAMICAALRQEAIDAEHDALRAVLSSDW